MSEPVWTWTHTGEQGEELCYVPQTHSYVTRTGGVYSSDMRPARENVNSGGYSRYHTKMPSGKWKNFLSHRTVAFAMCHKPEGCNVVNHIDGNKLNNAPENLEWTTPGGNQQHAYSTGLRRRSMDRESVVRAREMYSGGATVADIASEMSVSYAVVASAISKRKYRDIAGDHERAWTGNKKLTPEQVIHARCLLVMGTRVKDIANKVGVDRVYISNMKRGLTYNV